MELPFEGDWDSLVSQSNRWSNVTELETRASNLLSIALKRVSRALVRPYKTWLREDYFIVHLPEISAQDGSTLTAADLLASHAREIAQLVRGDSIPLSDAERQEVLQSSISYSRTDLLVVGWTGALVYANTEDVEQTIQMLEYAINQLLAFRHYDGL